MTIAGENGTMWGRKMSKMPHAERRLAVLLPEMVSRTFSGVSRQDRTGETEESLIFGAPE